MSQEIIKENEKDECFLKELFDIYSDEQKDEGKTLPDYIESSKSNNDVSTNEKTEGSEDFKKILEGEEIKEDIKGITIKFENSTIPEQSPYNKEIQDTFLIIDEPKNDTTNNGIKIKIEYQEQKSSKQNQGPNNNEPNLINNKQNLHNQNQVHNNQKNYIVYVFENRINFPEKELFFGALRKKKNIEDFFPKDIIYILIREEDLQNGDHKYYYKNILINEIYSILKRKDEKIFILIDIRK